MAKERQGDCDGLPFYVEIFVVCAAGKDRETRFS